jgi:sugar O-acyltransferase (sialic acid O-acetyltransferase NeuD family)
VKEVVLFGDRQVADLAHYYLTHDSDREVVAFTVDGPHLNAATLRGLPIVPFEDVQTRYPPDDFDMFVAIGSARMNKLRESKYHEAKDLGYELITYVSSEARSWPDGVIGDNCFILENSVIQPFAAIGNNVVMWSGCHIGHHSRIGDHCFLSPQVVVASNVEIEPNCLFGVNATIRDGITIARECLVGAGALIMKDTEPRQIYVGQRSTLLPMPSDRLPRTLLKGDGVDAASDPSRH